MSASSSQVHVVAGHLRCTDCGTLYEIRDGILRLLPAQAFMDPFMAKEQETRDVSASRYDSHFSEWENAVEVAAIMNEKALFLKKTILDLACGTGRITTHILPHAGAIISVDISEESLRILGQKAGPCGKLGLVWSDATQLRLLPDAFDLALSTQLLEHLPSIEGRKRFLKSVYTALNPSGVFVLTAYYYSSLRRLLRRSQEGFHSNGIFYHRFTRGEIESEFSGMFQILYSRPIQVDPRLIRAFGPFASRLAKVLESIVFQSLVGQLLYVRAQKADAAFAPRLHDQTAAAHA